MTGHVRLLACALVLSGGIVFAQAPGAPFGNAKGSGGPFGNAKGSGGPFGNAKGSGGPFGGAKGSNPAPRFILSGLAHIGPEILVVTVRNAGDGNAPQAATIQGLILKDDKPLQQARAALPALKAGEQTTVLITVPGARFDRAGFLARAVFGNLQLTSKTERLPEEQVTASPFGRRR
jgi:hypothetical protein